jgi:hypothetical protein
MKTKLKDFNLFVDECKKWIKILELSRWDVVYNWCKSNEEWQQAGCQVYHDSHAEIFFDKKWETDPINTKNIKDAAKHEVIHLLLGNIRNNVYKRFLNENEVRLAEEEVVRILVKII